jgi:diguanylate cyclase (GGDEF)-like protein
MARRSKVLLVSHPEVRSVQFRAALTKAGYAVKMLQPGPDFLKGAQQWRPDLIIVGPGDGTPTRATLFRRLKDDPKTRAVPILALLDRRPSPGAWAQVTAVDDVMRGPVIAQELAIRVRALLRMRRLTNDLQRTVKRLRAQARLDDLTGLGTHGAFKERLAREFQRAQRYTRPVSVLMIDVDHFKNYNDSFGHPTGDRLLRVVGRFLARQLRDVDFAARYGGDEFALILPETPKISAGIVAERLRKIIETHPFPHRDCQPMGLVTVSIGVATWPDDADSPKRLVEVADRFLYLAKAEGRNRVKGLADESLESRSEGA